METQREQATAIFSAGLDAVRAFPLLRDCAHWSGVGTEHAVLRLVDAEIPVNEFDRVCLVGGGKAGASMAAGLLCSLHVGLSPEVVIEGRINVPEATMQAFAEQQREIGSRREISNLIVDEVRPIGSNEPTRRAVQRTGEMMRMLRTADSRTLVIALISGGGSALMSQPVAGITLDQMLRTIRVLSAAGADITDLNTVRKQIDCVKGGGLRANFSGQHFVSLVISDVLGDPLDVIASGPTVSNSTGPDDALRVLKQFDQQGQIPETIYHAIDRSIAAQGSFNQASVSTRSSDGELPCHPDVFVLANNATAVDAAGVCAERLGMGHVMQTQRADAFGDEVLAENVGRRMAEVLLEWSRDAAGGNDGHRVPNCLITGGEPVVQLCPESQRGRGGRNQQLVLAAMHRLSQSDVSDEERNRIVVLSGGTDGEDGPTDAAGAVLDAGVWQRYRDHANVLSIEDALRRNDAHTFFQRCGGLLITGPTHTNVCDLRVGLI